MKADRYIKSVLTLIAACLVLIVLNQLELIPKAYAGEGGSPELPQSARYGLVPLNEDGSISVRLDPLSELDVNIVGVSTSDELEVEVVDFDVSDEIDVNIDEIGGSSVSMGGPLPVEIE